jgi:hypothetical protein
VAVTRIGAAAALLLAAAAMPAATPARAQPASGNVGPSAPLSPGLAQGSTTGGANGGTTSHQPGTAANGRATMLAPASRSFSLRNYAGQPIVEATATMTDGSTQKLTQTGPIAAAGASQIVVPLNQCLAGLTVKLRSGQSFQTGQLNDCRVTQITVNRNGIQLGSTQTPGTQTGGAPKP